MMARKKLIPKVDSIGDLKRRAKDDPRYAQLAIAAAQNLGYAGPSPTTLDVAFAWLERNADETSESWIVDEINFVRDCI